MGVGDFYDKEGKPITLSEWGRLHDDQDYMRVGLTPVGPYMVSTVWLGMDHGFTEEGPPVIFETMVFTNSAWEADRSDEDRELLLELDCVRYNTLQEALEGHQEMVLLVEATTTQEPPTEPSEGDSGGSGASGGPDVVLLVAYDALNVL